MPDERPEHDQTHRDVHNRGGLIPADVAARLPGRYATCGEDEPTAHVRLTSPAGTFCWDVVEYDPAPRIAYGLAVDGHESEFGYISVDELESVTGPLGRKIERDLNWKPKPLSGVDRDGRPSASPGPTP